MCGSTNYGDQPNPLHSEMEVRDMPAPGGEDPGGNPLREGILADKGWGPSGTDHGTGRDEAFASIHANVIERQEAVIPWHMAADFEIEQVVAPGPHTVEVDAPGQPIILQHEDPAVLDDAKRRIQALYRAAGLFSMKNMLGVAGGIAGGALGTLLLPGVGTAAGAELGAGLGGGAAAAAGGGIGGWLGNNAGRLVGSAVGHQFGENAGGGADTAMSGGATPDPSAMGPEQFRGIDQLSHIVVGAYGDDFSSPSSQDRIPANDTDDPEQVDPHEKNDGDNDTWQKDFSVNGEGGSTQHHGFDEENSQGLAHVGLLLPLLLHYFEQGHGSGAEDPLIQALDHVLEGENPGYKDTAGDDNAIHEVVLRLKGDKRNEGAPDVKDEAGDKGSGDSFDDNDIEKESNAPPGAVMFQPGSPEEAELQSGAWPKGGPETCPNCQRTTTMQLGGCPQCGHTVYQHPPSRVASGPRTPEQFKAVADLLRQQGRESEIQNLIDAPDQYETELAEVQQRQDVTPADTPGQPPVPTQEETPPGAGMPMPAPPTGMQPMGAVVEAADNVAEPCPRCDSHTTALIDNEGHVRCHSCKNVWKMDSLLPADGDSTHNTVTANWQILAEEGHNHIVRDPAADQHPREDIRQEQDPGLTWQDSSGQPLKVGSEYLMYSKRYEIPDHIQITGVKPGGAAITYKLTDEYGIDHETEITREDKDLYEYTFEPGDSIDQGGAVNQVNDPGIEEQNSYAGQGDPGQQTDLSDSSPYRASGFERGVVRRASQPAEADALPEDAVAHGDPNLAWLREAGAAFTLSEQRAFVEERGVARNADRLDLSNTHYESGFGGADEDDFLFGL